MPGAWDRKPNEPEMEWRKRRQRMMAAMLISKKNKEEPMAKGKGRIHDSHPSNIAYRDIHNNTWYTKCCECRRKKTSSKGSIGINKLIDIWTKRGWIEYLQEAFNSETGMFKEGYSDQIISETVGLSHQVIITIREEYFGELKARSGLDILRDELAAFAAEMNEKVKLFTTRIKEIERNPQ